MDDLPRRDDGVRRPGLVRFKIKMQRSYAEFDDEQKNRYLDDLARIAGCTRAQIEAHQVFIRGCVIHEFEIPAVVAERLMELFGKAQRGELDDSALDDIRAFLARENVVEYKDYKVVTIQVHDERPKKAAIFVHGWRGDEVSFGRLPEWIESQTGWKSAVYSYPTGIWSHSPSIALVSAAFDNWVRDNFPEAALAIIAHSMGGVVVRHALTEQPLRDTPLDTKLLVLCASPETGAAVASLAAKVPTIRNQQLRELEPDSPFLFSLNKWWDKWVKTNVPAVCKVRSLVGTSDDVVSLNSARGTDTDPIPVLGAGHSDIVKPKSEKGEVVTTIARLIREAGKAAESRSLRSEDAPTR
jgi:pimeloyl-ACP methyl ester carboxylesterase